MLLDRLAYSLKDGKDPNRRAHHHVGSRPLTDRERLYLFDTTLRDGAQTPGIDFSVEDKITIASMLDEFGLDYIEGGYPGANPTDTEFFSPSPAPSPPPSPPSA